MSGANEVIKMEKPELPESREVPSEPVTYVAGIQRDYALMPSQDREERMRDKYRL